MLTISKIADFLLQHATTPLAVSNSIIVLPSRSAKKALEEHLRQCFDGAALLPKIYTVNETDVNLLPYPVLEHKPLLSSLQREVFMAALLKQSGIENHQNAMAEGLLKLIDEFYISDIDFNTFDENITKDMDAHLLVHWQQTQQFLQQVFKVWPILTAGSLEPQQAYKQFYQHLGKQIQQHDYPVIVAGVLNTAPFFLQFLEQVNQAPQGMILMPEKIDAYLNNPGTAHPDYKINLIQQNIPTKTTKSSLDWLGLIFNPDAAKKSVSSFSITMDTVDSLHQEALLIALKMRHALEKPQQKIALVTADRHLAQLVQQQLSHWNLAANDSAGIALYHTPAGQFLDLMIVALQQGGAKNILKFLKHPFLVGAEKHCFSIEKAVFRGQKFTGGFYQLLAVLPKKSSEQQTVYEFIKQLIENLAPLQTALKKGNIANIAQTHCEVAATLTNNEIFKGENDKTVLQLLQQFQQVDGESDNYPLLFQNILKKNNITPIRNAHNRLFIWGMTESLLLEPDVIIMGGLNEKVFPSSIATDPWLNRIMRQQIGLPPAEGNIGVAAQLFCHLLQLPEVHLTRSSRVGGTPSLPSPFWEKLECFFNANDIEIQRDKLTESLLTIFYQRNTVDMENDAAFSPPITARPNKISVTDINLLNKDPYAFYAKRILKLQPLDNIDDALLHLDKGNTLHKILEDFLKAQLHELSDDSFLILKRGIDRALENFKQFPIQHLFWQQQFYNVAEWFIDKEIAQREQGRKPALLEHDVEWQFQDIAIRGKVDRIDRVQPNVCNIVDYKSGTAPTGKSITDGRELQLLVEALMAKNGAFATFNAVSKIEYWQLSGKNSNKISAVTMSEQLLEQVDNYLQELLKYYLLSENSYEATGDSYGYTGLIR